MIDVKIIFLDSVKECGSKVENELVVNTGKLVLKFKMN